MNALQSFSWISVGSALADHLWQSTLFACAAAALTLVLRKNQARIRYWLWLGASIKFLLPFSLLVALGSRLRWSQPAAAGQASFSFVVEEMSQTFAPATSQLLPATHSSAYALTIRVLPVCLLILWFAGCLAILIFWCLRWRRIASALCEAAPITSGRELETLRRLERMAGITRPTGLVVTKSRLEPGILGIFRPVMFLPSGIPDRLTDSQLQAIITHELCHVRRRDNLAAALHMLVEALFWFHPFVWWIGARLVDERERACDEEVLRFGSEPQVYAEGILKVCEFYLETPLVCAAGVTGSNLKKRIEEIMVHRIAHKLEKGKKVLLAALAAAAVLVPVTFGLLHPSQSRAQSRAQSATTTTPGFESVSIQPNMTGRAMPPFNIIAGPDGNFVGFKFSDSQFLATHATLPQIIRIAYGVLDFQITGGPDWLNREKYDVNAKFLHGIDDAKFWRLPQDEQARQMDQRRLQLQALLADRFKLVVHLETKQLPVYSLTMAINGPKLRDASPGDSYTNGFKRRDGVPMGAGLWVPQQGVLLGQGVSTGMLAAHLSRQLGRKIVDNTGLTGKYDFNLQFAAGKDESASLLVAIPEQLGLQLIPQTGPVEMIVIDRAEPVEAVASSAVAGPVALGILHSASSQAQSQVQSSTLAAAQIESASIKPSQTATDQTGAGNAGKPVVSSRLLFRPEGFQAENVTLQQLIRAAFGVQKPQIQGGPEWGSTRLYDADVKFTNDGSDHIQRVTKQRLALQALLADRFKLQTHRELKPLAVYELAVGRDGSKLTEVRTSGESRKEGLKQGPPGHFQGTSVKISTLVEVLEYQLNVPIVDKTGLKRNYDFNLTVDWPQTRPLPDDPSPLLKAVSEQLGLELNPATDPVEVLVIDHAEPVTSEQRELVQSR
jgi:bla regulator protein blaR1